MLRIRDVKERAVITDQGHAFRRLGSMALCLWSGVGGRGQGLLLTVVSSREQLTLGCLPQLGRGQAVVTENSQFSKQSAPR